MRYALDEFETFEIPANTTLFIRVEGGSAYALLSKPATIIARVPRAGVAMKTTSEPHMFEFDDDVDTYKVSLGYSAEIDFVSADPCYVGIMSPERILLSVRRAKVESYVDEGEVFTNVDNMPDESKQMSEVAFAMRQLEIERRAFLQEIADARAAENPTEPEGEVEEPIPDSERPDETP